MPWKVIMAAEPDSAAVSVAAMDVGESAGDDQVVAPVLSADDTLAMEPVATEEGAAR